MASFENRRPQNLMVDHHFPHKKVADRGPGSHWLYPIMVGFIPLCSLIQSLCYDYPVIPLFLA